MQNTKQLEINNAMTAINKDLWDKVCKTNPDDTKKVTFGRKFTAIDAYSQIDTATKLWGSYGKDWALQDIKFTKIEGETAYFVEAMFRYPDGEFEITTAIEYRKGNHFDSDYSKKAITDMLTKALSMLGWNNDVFRGRYDDNKYVNEMRDEFKPTPVPVAAPVQAPVQAPVVVPTQAPSALQPTKQQKPQVQEVSERLSAEIFCIKQAIKNQEPETLKEAWYEISDVDQLVIWTPQSRGGPFTNVERNVISVMRKAQINQSQIANSPNTVIKKAS